jgi:hypothetical protein
MQDYIPRKDPVFNGWLANFTEAAIANAVALGISPAEIIELQNFTDQWSAAHNEAFEARANYQAMVERKADARTGAVSYVRELVQRIQTNPAVTDGNRATLGITIRDKTRTRPALPTEPPGIDIDFSRILCHIIHWGPAPKRERINGKPQGVYACEIRSHVGEPPQDYDQMDLAILKVATKSPVTIYYSGIGGQTIYYACRYLNSRMEPGPWSHVTHAIVAV